MARDSHSDLSRLRKFWYLAALWVFPGCGIALRFSIVGREKDMSKSGWLRQAGAWTLRTSTRPFRTGSWKKRLTLVLATTTATGGMSAAGYRYLHDRYTEAVASSDVNGLERSPLPSMNRNPVVPLNVDEEKPSPRPVPSVEMHSSRRNPAAHRSSESGDDVASDAPTGRSRFESLPANPIRPVSDEQPAETSNSRNPSTLPRLSRTASRFNAPVEQEQPESDRSEPSRLRNSAPANDEIPVDDSVAVDEPNTSPDDMAYDEEPTTGNGNTSEPAAPGSSLPELPNTEQPAADPADSPRSGAGSNRERDESPRNLDVPPLGLPRSRPEESLPPRPLGATSSDKPASVGRSASTPQASSDRNATGRSLSDLSPLDRSSQERANLDRPVGPGTSRNALKGDGVSGGTLSGGVLTAGASAGDLLASPTPGARHLDGPQVPTLAIEKIAPAEIQVGRAATFQIKVRNTGKVTAHDVVVIDQIPTGTDVVELTPLVEPSADSSVRWNLGTLAPGADSVITLKLMPRSEGEIGSVAEVTFRAQASTRTTSTRPQVQVEISAPESVLIGETASMKMTITNKGSGTASDLFLDAVLPEGFTHPAGRELQSPLGNLAPGATKTISLPLKAARAGEYEIACSATNESNVQVTESVQVRVVSPQLELAISGSKLRYLERPATYQVAVANPGTAPAEDVEIVMFLSKGMKFVSANNSGQYDRSSNAVHWHLERLPAGAKGEVQVSIIPQELGLQKLRVEGSTKSGIKESDERAIQVEGISELEFSINDTEDPVDVGSNTGYEILVTNRGSQAANNVQLTVEFPAELEPIEGTGTTTARVGNNQVSFDPVARLAPGDKAVFKIAARGIRAGDSRVRVQILSDDLRNPITKEERTVVHADDR